MSWPRPAGYETVDSYIISIDPSSGVTPSSPHEITNPFDEDVSEYLLTFSTLDPASVYTISVVAYDTDADEESEADCNTMEVTTGL